jgi:hypothetical protein
LQLDQEDFPSKEDFYNELKEQHISDADYEAMKKVYTDNNCRTVRDYLKIYAIQ